ncbi:APC family permease [Microbacterium sp. No. 7]|uniref:APC family permease n=1 Tax=Microbacterium sp. No. 7 TaxID=1714373 RepID=UPI0006ECEBD8|nr:APC family permease [Microbacterium sp. No. 7]ALJ21600.1 hypothetical protein AOA12_17555 [Microbacterium sp. No. 7]
MRSLERAIAQRVPVAGLEATSPLNGLRRRRAGGIDVVAQSVAAVAPAGVALVNPGVVGDQAGGFATIAMAATIVVVVLLAATISVFARRIASTGSLYTFAVRGLGRTAGIVTGAALGLGYAGIALGCLLDSARRIATLLAGGTPPPWLAAVLVVGFAAFVAVVVMRGVRISTRVLLVVEAIGMIAIVAVAVTVFAAHGWNLSALVPRMDAGIDLDAVLSGMAVGLIAFVGFESGVALGPETRRPLATVPRALLWTVVAVCLSYLIGASAHTVGSASSGAGAAASGGSAGGSSGGSDIALAAIGEAVGWRGIGPLVEVIVALSFLACTLATTTALVRLTFVMSREGLLPGLFGRTGSRGTPARGGAVITAAVAVIPLAAVLVAPLDPAVDRAADTVSVIGYTLAYLLVALAAPAFLLRIGEFRWISALPAALVGAALAATLVHYVVVPPRGDVATMWASVALIAGVAVALLVRARHPGVAGRLGMYDSPVTADTIGGQT